MSKRSSIAVGLTDDLFVDLRFFHFGAHGVQVVGGRNHREEDDQDTGQSQHALQRTELAL